MAYIVDESIIKVPNKSIVSSILTKTGRFSKKLIKNILIKIYQNTLPIDKAVISYSEGGMIGSFQFHILERESVNYEAEVTDHYIDTNRPIQDHIAWKPVTITLQGLQGRYFHDISKDISHSIEYYRIFNTVTSFIPNMTGITMARKVKSTISKLTSGNSIVNMIANKITSFAFGFFLSEIQQYANDWFNLYKESAKVEDAQTEAFLYLEDLFLQGKPTTVVTTWRSYDNMLVTSLKPTRDNNGDITEFTVTLKQISTVNSIVVDRTEKVEGGNSANQSSKITEKGTTEGVPKTLPTPATEQEVKDSLKVGAVKDDFDKPFEYKSRGSDSYIWDEANL